MHIAIDSHPGAMLHPDRSGMKHGTQEAHENHVGLR